MNINSITKYIIVGIVTFISLQSCENALDVVPNDSLSPSTFFRNENEIKLYTNSFYTGLVNVEDLYKENSDVIIKAILDPAISGQRTVPDKGGNWVWTQLRKINFYLENSSNCENIFIREKYDALARFFRAYFYFEKVKYFGDVPWFDKVLDSNDKDLYKPRDSREYIMSKILEDIDYAIEYLSRDYNLYRVTHWTALALKSRICLFEGTFRKYHNVDDSEKYLQLCEEASRIFMTSNYTLYDKGETPYFTLFSTFDNRPEEYILARDFNQALSLSNDAQVYTNMTTGGRPGLSKRVVNSYLMKDGSRFTDIPNYDKMEFYEECQERDPRLAQTIRTPGYKQIGGNSNVAPNLAYTLTGYHIIKYSNHKDYDQIKGYNDIPYFRTAEVYLNYAESKAEIGTITQEDIDKTINIIRKRAGMSGMLQLNEANENPDPFLLAAETGYPNVDKGKNMGVILEIRRERTVELIMEGFRYWDIIRWKEGKAFDQPFYGIYIPGPGTYDLNKNGKNDVCFYTDKKPSVFVSIFLKIGEDVILSEGDKGYILTHSNIIRSWNEDRDYYYPIPIQDRSLSGGTLTQNPEWIDGLQF